MRTHALTAPVARAVPRLALVTALTMTGLALTANAAAAKPIPNQYIVTVKSGHAPETALRGAGASAKHVYTSALNGFAAKLNASQLAALRRDPNVVAIEQDAEVTGSVTQAMNAAGDPWGLDRIDQHPLPLSKSYTYNKDGTGVRVYVLDTGIQAGHVEYGGRGQSIFNATSGVNTDCHGHGTHVAGTVGANTFGVAKRVYLRGVKVLGSPDCSKSGTWADVIEGIDWVRVNHIKPAVANLSLGGPSSAAVNTAVGNLVAAGVFVSVAAGNENANACTKSPASAPSVFTTASSTKTDAKAGSSNWGTCVDGYAPGDSIKSSTLGGGSGWMSGTSMASPHVAGTGALLCSYGAAFCTPNYITSWINDLATAGVITGNPAGTPNRLLWKNGL